MEWDFFRMVKIMACCYKPVPHRTLIPATVILSVWLTCTDYLIQEQKVTLSTNLVEISSWQHLWLQSRNVKSRDHWAIKMKTSLSWWVGGHAAPAHKAIKQRVSYRQQQYLPVSCRLQDTSGTDSTDIVSSESCRWCTTGSPNKRTSCDSVQCAWKNLHSIQQVQTVTEASEVVYVNYYYYYIHLMAFSRTTWVSRHQKGKPFWI